MMWSLFLISLIFYYLSFLCLIFVFTLFLKLMFLKSIIFIKSFWKPNITIWPLLVFESLVQQHVPLHNHCTIESSRSIKPFNLSRKGEVNDNYIYVNHFSLNHLNPWLVYLVFRVSFVCFKVISYVKWWSLIDYFSKCIKSTSNSNIFNKFVSIKIA